MGVLVTFLQFLAAATDI